MKMKKLRRETLQLIILMSISIPLIGISIIYGTSVDWVLYWGWVLFIIYQVSPIVFAAYKTKKELSDFEEDRNDFKTFIAKRLSVFKSLKILSISYSLLFGLFSNIYFRVLLEGYQTQALFFSAISLGLFGINFLFSTYALVKYHYLTNDFFYPKEILINFSPTEEISEDLLRYLNLLQIPYFIKKLIKYSLYLHFITLLPILFAIRF